MKLFKKHKAKRKNLRLELAKWVEQNLGAEFVNEALEKYDKINSGESIGGFVETVVFLDMIDAVKNSVKE